MDREWTEVEPRMDRSTLATMCRYIAVMVMVFGLGIGEMWGTDPQDTYYKFTATKSAGQTIAPVSGDGGNITMGSNSAATVTSNAGSYCGVSYTYAANIGNADAKGFSLNINASTTNPAHVFLVLSASSDRTIYLKNGSSAVDQCYGRGVAASPALVELITTKSGSHIVYASGTAAVYAVRVIYENNDTWQELKGLTSITLNKDKTLADDFTTFLFFRLQDLTFNGDGVLVSNTQNILRYTINFKALADGEVTLNCANPGSSDRTLSVKELTRPQTLSGTAVYSTTVAKKSPAEYADHKFDVEKGKEYVIGFSGAGATIKSVNFTAAAPSTCSSAYSFHYGPNGGSWETPICFTQVGETHEWNIENFTIPSHANGEFWVGYAGATNGQSVTKRWTDGLSDTGSGIMNGAMVLLPTNGSIVGQATGATGTLSIWDNSSSKNQYVGFKPDGYAIMYGGNNYAFSTTATANMLETDVVTLPNVSSTTYQMGIKTASSYTTCAHSSSAENINAMGVTTVDGGLRKIWLYSTADSWIGSNAKMAIWDATNSKWGDDTDAHKFMTKVNDNLWYGYVPTSASTIILVRVNPSNDDPAWGWGQSWNIIPGDLNNYVTITGSWSNDKDDDNKSKAEYTISSTHPATGDKGKFRMWDNSNASNWYVHWIPYYVLTYDKNDEGASGTTTQTERNSESSTLTVSVASNGFTAPTGYTFDSWNTAVGGGGDSYAAGDSYTLTANGTLYAQWSPKEYTITLNGNGGSGHTSSVSATYNSSTLSDAITNPSLDCYTFDGWYSGSGGTGTLIIDDNGDLQASTTYTDGSGNWTNDGAVTLYAKWSKTPTSLTVSRSGTEATPAGGSPIGTEYTLTCSAVTGSISTYQWKQNTTGSKDGAVNAVGTGTTSANFNPVPAAAGAYYYFCVATDACGNEVETELSGCFTFTEPTYSVTYNANLTGTSGSTTGLSGKSDGFIFTTATNGFSRSGYKFKWWNTKSDGTGQDYYAGENDTIAAADQTLYARWDTVASNQAFWSPLDTASKVSDKAINITEGDMVLTSGGSTDAADINVGLTADACVVSKHSNIKKHAKVLAIKANDKYIDVHFSDGSPINKLWLGATTTESSSKDIVVVYSATSDFSTAGGAAHEFKQVGSNSNLVTLPGNTQSTKAITDVSPSTTDTYYYARIYRKITTANSVFDNTANLGSGKTIRIYSIKAQKGASYYTGLSVTKDPSAGSASTPSISATSVEQGSGVTVTAGSAASGYVFLGWESENGTFANASSLSTTFTPTADNAVATAKYAAVKTITIKFLHNGNTEGWSVQGVTTYPANQSYSISVSGDWTVLTFSNVYAVSNINLACAGHDWDYLNTSTKVTENGCYEWDGDAMSCDLFSVTYANGGATSGEVPADANSYYTSQTVTVLGNTGSLTRTISGDEATFYGWNTNSNMYGGTHYDAGATFAMPSSNVTLYAVWGYSITWNLNGGEWVDYTAPTHYIYGQGLASLPNAAKISKAVNTFDHWELDYDKSTVTSIATDATGNVQLNAIWSPTCSAPELSYATASVEKNVGDAAFTNTLTNPNSLSVTYSSSETGVATVNETSGMVTIVSAGETTITATWAGNASYCEGSATYTLTVSSGCTPQSLVKTVITGYKSSAFQQTTTGTKAGTPIIDLKSNETQAADLDGDKINETGYKMTGDKKFYVQLSGTTLKAGDIIKVGITKPSDYYTDPVTSKTDVLIICAWNGSAVQDSIGKITGVSGAGYYTYTVKEADLTRCEGANDTIHYVGLARSRWSQNPYMYSIEVLRPCAATTYAVTYAAGGATGGEVPEDPSEYEEGATVTVLGNTGSLVKNGYTFAGWNDGSTDYEADDTFTMPDEDVTLTAQWTANDYTITYHLNGASWASSAGVAVYTVGTGATLPVAGDMTNTGYTFNGWKNNSGLTGDNITTIGTSEYGNKEFWAKWTENTYDVTYNANGGTGTTAAQNGHYITLRDNGFTAPSGKTFVEWNTANDGSGDSYNPGEEVELTANLALYAIWATDYTITWDASPKLSGVDAKPNLGGGNYTITASVATWTGSLTTSMISAETSGVTITDVLVDNSVSPKTITATFNVGASVAGESVTFELDVPAAGVYSAKSSTKNITIDCCTGSSSGSDGVLFSAEFKDSGLGTSDICTAANTDYTFTTSELKAAPTGGSISAYTTGELSHLKYVDNGVYLKGTDAVIQIDLDNAIATNDLFEYVNVHSSNPNAYLRHTSPTTTTDQIVLTGYSSRNVKVMLPAAFNGENTLYIVKNSTDFKLHKAAIIRPAFLMLVDDEASTGNLEGTDVALTTSNYLSVMKGGHVYYTSPTSGDVKITQSSSKNYITLAKTAGYLKVVLSDALQEGDIIGFDTSNGSSEICFATTTTRSTDEHTSSQLYTVGSSSPLKGQTTFYIWYYSSSTTIRGLQIARSGVAGGGGGTDKITTTLTWDTDLSGGVAAETGDADFTHTVTQDKNSLGAITYSSNNTSVATVNASGKVHIAGAGNATITATMAASGCYKEATVSYNITVTDNCADVAGTISTEDLGCDGIQMTVTGHTTSGETVSYQWYKDGVSLGSASGAQTATYTATEAGEYYVIVTNTGSGHCSKASTNTITLEDSEAATATKIVNEWYVKNGRRTPDIALVQTENATNFTVTSGGSPITTFAGCAFYLGADGIIYLKGQQEDDSAPTGLTSGDETLKFTATACGGNSSELSITIHKQESTTRPSVAFVVDGTKGGDFDEEEENHSVNTELYQYLDYGADETGAFDLTGQNVYSTVDEQAIREHYSQFDAILITDDPSTDTKSGKKSYVDAFGTMIDVRPILTMEAFVSKWGNWKAKGIDGNPESPNPRQYKMKLQCKDHAIFKDLSVGTNVETETIDGVEYWTVTMVDNTKSPYSGVADGTDTDTKPALQGFSADDVNSLLLLGQISGGSLYAGVERQEETAARLMLLGLNAKALPNALTPEGKKVIENALKYLIETDLEKVDDCSNYFTGATDTDWNKDSNWSKGHVPNSPNVRVRILSECVINSGTYKVAEVDIATSGKSLNKAGEMTGKLTINAGAALIVGGKIRTAEAPYFNTGDLKPTTEEDLVINTSSTAQAALIFDNEDGDTKATVSFYSLGRNDGAFKYQYIASPMEVVPVSESYHGSGVYTYVYTEAGGWERRGYYTDLYAFEGVAITTRSATATEYTVSGTLAHTNEREIDITVENGGDNMIGNSWTAPIQISELSKAPNTATLASSTVYVYCSGRDATLGTGASGSTEVAGQWLAVPFNAASFKDWTGLKVIPAMNAFEFLATAAGTITLNYDTLVRGGSQYDLTAKARAPKRIVAHEGIDLVRIRVADTKTHNDIHLFEGDVFSEAFDDGWEAKYMTGEGISAQLYAMNGEDKMAVLATSTLEGTVLGFAPGREREYTFSFLGADNGYYLNDLKLKTSTPISETEHYTFTYEEGDTNRFYISKTAIDAPQTPTGVDNTHSGEVKAQKFIYNDKMYIMINGRVYSAEGQIVK